MGVSTGDFIGFSFAGHHSTDLGICRVSDGNRYNDIFLPTVQDKTVQVPGGDGTYYFGSYFTQKPFTINVAFDEMTEEQYQNMSKVFGDKKIHPLIFDDHPYKVYYAKVTGNPQLKTICFDDPYTKGRVYKGEGTLNFTCYCPYAESQFNYIEDYYKAGYQNVDEWAAASGLPESRNFQLDGIRYTYEEFDIPEDKEQSVYSIETYVYNKISPVDFILTIPFVPEQTTEQGRIKISINGKVDDKNTTFELMLDSLQFEKGVNHILQIDTVTRLIKFKQGEEDFKIINRKISDGDFFKIYNEGNYLLTVDFDDYFCLFSKENLPTLEYKYRYF